MFLLPVIGNAPGQRLALGRCFGQSMPESLASLSRMKQTDIRLFPMSKIAYENR
ncbi:hypothetical protein [Burkholderia metallica]|uniref:hypothetical protein n=1 Tax=Burkholderia metallica TaxID=488729 RepID=UPI00131D64A4|nr:hypothetical protein [Burkholderia metallica]